MLYKTAFLAQCGLLINQVNGASDATEDVLSEKSGQFVYDPKFQSGVEMRSIFKFARNGQRTNLVIKKLAKHSVEAQINNELFQKCPDAPNLLIGQCYESDGEIKRRLKEDLSKHIDEDTNLKNGVTKLNDGYNHFLVMEEAGTSLREIPEGQFTPRARYDICRNVFEGIKQLHDVGIGHKDIHEGQVVYNVQEKSVKLFDFGQSANKNEKVEIGNHFSGKIKIDIWRYDFIRYAKDFLVNMSFMMDKPFVVFGPRDFTKQFRNTNKDENECRQIIEEKLNEILSNLKEQEPAAASAASSAPTGQGRRLAERIILEHGRASTSS